MNPPTADHGYGRPSIRTLGYTSRKPRVLECWPLGRTIQAGLGVNPAVPRDGWPVARLPRLARMAGRHAHLRDLVGAIHQTSELAPTP